MQPNLAAVVVCVGLGAAGVAVNVVGPLSRTHPEGIPSRAVLDTWEEVAGEVELEGGSVAYRFYVSPDRPGIYRLTQYQVEEASAGGQPQSEKLLWNANPAVTQPLELYERTGNTWVRVPPHTDPYRQEMGTAIRIYQLHNLVTHQQGP